MQIGQLALAVILLSGAGLLARSFVALATVPTGFDVDRLLRLELVSMERLHGGPETSSALAHQLEERLRVLPGVVGVARSGGTALRFGAVVEPQGGTTRRVEVLASIGVDTAFFGTMGISVAEGRAFRSDDHQDYSSASILDRDLAQVLWPDENPVGRTFRIDDEGWRTVVGLSDDARMEGPTDPFGPFRLFGLRDPEERPGPFVWIRTEGDPAAQVEVVRSVVRAVDPDQPIASLETGREILGETVANPRLLLTAVATFAVLALLLASVGAYGLVAFMVAEARREIGIRLVLGAEPPRLLAEMLGRGLLLGGAGVALGLACSAAVAHVARAVLFGVSPLDPVALGLAPSVLLIACALALIGPARRASRVDPTVVLGAE
jgi:putative ABC transport system permease protein